MKTNFYVDGFNLYYGSLKGSDYKWLDLHKLFSLIFPENTIHRIRYFTANVKPRPGNPNQHNRQAFYLRAIQTISCLTVHHGNYQESIVSMPKAEGMGMVRVKKSEEKGSDVNLATYLLLDLKQATRPLKSIGISEKKLEIPLGFCGLYQ